MATRSQRAPSASRRRFPLAARARSPLPSRGSAPRRARRAAWGRCSSAGAAAPFGSPRRQVACAALPRPRRRRPRTMRGCRSAASTSGAKRPPCSRRAARRVSPLRARVAIRGGTGRGRTRLHFESPCRHTEAVPEQGGADAARVGAMCSVEKCGNLVERRDRVGLAAAREHGCDGATVSARPASLEGVSERELSAV
eukprot:1377830-Prymnesium_polylepis.2